MAESTRELVVLMTRGTDHELSSVGSRRQRGHHGRAEGLCVSDQRCRRRSGPQTCGGHDTSEPAGAAKGPDRGFSAAWRHALGLPAMRQGARLRAGRSHRRGRHRWGERHARADQGRRRHSQLLIAAAADWRPCANPSYRPKRRRRCWKARTARRKSILRKAGQNTSVK